MFVVERGHDAASLPDAIQEVPLRVVPTAEQAAAEVWVAIWLRMIPVINATRGLNPKPLIKSVLSIARRPLALSFLEHDLAVGDPAIVRGAILELLRTGQLLAASLHTKALSLHTAIKPVP